MGCSSSIKEDGDQCGDERRAAYKQCNHHNEIALNLNEEDDLSRRGNESDVSPLVKPRKKSMSEEEFRVVLDATKEKFQKEMKILNDTDDYSTEAVSLSLHRISACLYDIHERNRRHFLGDELANLGFAELFVKIWSSLHRVDLFAKENVQAMRCLKKLKVIAWNYSDLSGVFGKAMGCSGALNLLLADLANPKLDVSNLGNNERRYLIKGSMGILHNCVRMCPDNRNLYRKANAVELLAKYQNASYLIVKVKALLCLAYVLDDEENERLNGSSGNIKFIIGLLDSALKSPSRTSKNYRFSTTEVVKGLNHLAIIDANKLRMVEDGVLPLYVALLQPECTDQEQLLTATGIWTLAFAPENKERIRAEDGCIEALRLLEQKTHSAELKHACCGALWELELCERREPRDLNEEDTTAMKISVGSKAHVMISYQQDMQRKVIKLRDTLREDGYNVCMCAERMDGDVIQAMADAVEKSSVVIICMSQRYKDSPMCRTEATYSLKLQKPIVAVVMESDFVIDGWLATLLGTTPYFDFHGDDHLVTEMPKIQEKLKQSGALPDDKASLADDNRHRPAQKERKLVVTSWSTHEVQQWLYDNGLQEVSEKFAVCDGEMLIQMKNLSQQAPEFFYSLLKTDAGLQDLFSILKFSKALDSLVIM